MLYHNSHLEAYRCPMGGVPAGSFMRIRFDCDEADNVTLRCYDGEEHWIPMIRILPTLFEAIFRLPDTPMLFWYDFIIRKGDESLCYFAPQDLQGGEGVCAHERGDSFQITVYDPTYQTPADLRGGIIYQIFPDRYQRDEEGLAKREKRIRAAHPEANFHESWEERPDLVINPEDGDCKALDFFGGTLKGITQHLNELQELGITILYLNPIFRSRTNHRYDTGSYEEIDPVLGTKADFSELCRKARKLGIRVILDGVFSHTGSDSQYFNKFGRYKSLGAAQSKDSPYYSWYSFSDYPQHYRTWWGFTTLPVVDKNNESYRRYLLDEKGILSTWLQHGGSGWRLDVADELPMDLIAAMRAQIKSLHPDHMLLGEVWEDASAKVSYGQLRSYCLGDTLDGVMNYPLRQSIIDFFTGKINAYALQRLILHQREVYPAPFLYAQMNLLGSHDRVRILNALAGFDKPGAIQMDREEAGKIHLTPELLALSKKRYVEALRLLCALPGAPTVYYGDEIGMQGMGDPWCRAPMDWNHADEALRQKVGELLRQRRQSDVLKRGWLDMEVPNENELLIRRYARDGKDAFGEKLEGDEICIRIRRS